MSADNHDKSFEVPHIVPEVDDEPFKDFLQEVDTMLGNTSLADAPNLNDPTAERSLPPSKPGDDEFEDIHFELDVVDEAALRPLKEGESPELNAAYADMQETFLAIMRQVLKPVTRYVKAILQGEESRELFEIINFTVTPLIDKVEKVELFQHTADLLIFKSTLARILATHFGTLSPEMREQLIKSFMEVKHTFNLDLRGNHRAVSNVLDFYRMLCFSKDIDVDDIRKFFAIGIPSLTWVRRTHVGEISSLSGIDIKQVRLLKKMVLHFRELSEDEHLEDGDLAGPSSATA